MINILPKNDLKEHIEDNSCVCDPDVIFVNEEMIIIHNSFDGRENCEKGAIDLNSDNLYQGYLKGLVTLNEIEDLLKESIEDEEYRVSISIRDIIQKIKSA